MEMASRNSGLANYSFWAKPGLLPISANSLEPGLVPRCVILAESVLQEHSSGRGWGGVCEKDHRAKPNIVTPLLSPGKVY